MAPTGFASASDRAQVEAEAGASFRHLAQKVPRRVGRNPQPCQHSGDAPPPPLPSEGHTGRPPLSGTPALAVGTLPTRPWVLSAGRGQPQSCPLGAAVVPGAPRRPPPQDSTSWPPDGHPCLRSPPRGLAHSAHSPWAVPRPPEATSGSWNRPSLPLPGSPSRARHALPNGHVFLDGLHGQLEPNRATLSLSPAPPACSSPHSGGPREWQSPASQARNPGLAVALPTSPLSHPGIRQVRPPRLPPGPLSHPPNPGPYKPL